MRISSSIFLVSLLMLVGCASLIESPSGGDLYLATEDIRFKQIEPRKYGLTISSFFLMETEVTNRMFRQFLRETNGYKTDQFIKIKLKARAGFFSTADPVYAIDSEDLLWIGDEFPSGREDFPVTMVNLEQAREFCEWLSGKYPEYGRFRLPSEEEWQAAAYGRNRSYPWGNTGDATAYVHSGQAHQVASLDRGKTPDGIYDLWGNVNELVFPRLGNSMVLVGFGVGFQGGGYKHGTMEPKETFWGWTHSSDVRSQDVGFRVLLAPSEAAENIERQTLKNLIELAVGKVTVTDRIAGLLDVAIMAPKENDWQWPHSRVIHELDNSFLPLKRVTISETPITQALSNEFYQFKSFEELIRKYERDAVVGINSLKHINLLVLMDTDLTVPVLMELSKNSDDELAAAAVEALSVYFPDANGVRNRMLALWSEDKYREVISSYLFFYGQSDITEQLFLQYAALDTVVNFLLAQDRSSVAADILVDRCGAAEACVGIQTINPIVLNSARKVIAHSPSLKQVIWDGFESMFNYRLKSEDYYVNGDEIGLLVDLIEFVDLDILSDMFLLGKQYAYSAWHPHSDLLLWAGANLPEEDLAELLQEMRIVAEERFKAGANDDFPHQISYEFLAAEADMVKLNAIKEKYAQPQIKQTSFAGQYLSQQTMDYLSKELANSRNARTGKTFISQELGIAIAYIGYEKLLGHDKEVVDVVIDAFHPTSKPSNFRYVYPHWYINSLSMLATEYVQQRLAENLQHSDEQLRMIATQVLSNIQKVAGNELMWDIVTREGYGDIQVAYDHLSIYGSCGDLNRISDSMAGLALADIARAWGVAAGGVMRRNLRMEGISCN